MITKQRTDLFIVKGVGYTYEKLMYSLDELPEGPKMNEIIAAVMSYENATRKLVNIFTTPHPDRPEYIRLWSSDETVEIQVKGDVYEVGGVNYSLEQLVEAIPNLLGGV